MTLLYSTPAHACLIFLPLSSRMRTLPLTRRPFITRRCLTTLGLRREDPSRIWERRTPLTPHAVQSLLADAKDQLKVEVESCKRRCFPDSLYSDVSRDYVVGRSLAYHRLGWRKDCAFSIKGRGRHTGHQRAPLV